MIGLSPSPEVNQRQNATNVSVVNPCGLPHIAIKPVVVRRRWETSGGGGREGQADNQFCRRYVRGRQVLRSVRFSRLGFWESAEWTIDNNARPTKDTSTYEA